MSLNRAHFFQDTPRSVWAPLARATLDGLASLRGKVLPISSLRRMFGFSEKEHDDTTRMVVIDVVQPLGFVVDRAASVVGGKPSHIEDAGSIRSTVDSPQRTYPLAARLYRGAPY